MPFTGSDRHWQLQIPAHSADRTGSQICHCEGALRPWQSRSTRPDHRKAIGENATAFPRLPRRFAPRNDKSEVRTVFTMARSERQCLPEIATSAYGLLAMTNLRAVRHKINTANIADLHGAQGKPQRACFRRFPFHVKGRPLRMSSDIIPAALSGFIIEAGFS